MSTTVQLDLFGEVEAAASRAAVADVERRRTGLLVLRDYFPNTLEVLIGERRPEGNAGCGPRFTRPWAYAVSKRAFHFEHETTWGGWDSRPAGIMTWPEVDAIAADDRIRDVRAWACSLTMPDRWRVVRRPFALDGPDQWHPSYLEHERESDCWPERLRAWTTVQAILTDAMEAS
jgi:hypothetical protein